MAALWTSLQRAETLMVAVAAHQNPSMRANLFKGSSLDATARQLLVRMACGFDPGQLSAAAYLVRYPFSTIEAIPD